MAILSLSNWHRTRDVLTVFTMKNLRARYRGSALGIYWSLLNPVVMTVVYVAIFSFSFKSYYHDSLDIYALAVFIGLLAITFFSQSTSQALLTIVGNAALLQKIRIPYEAFPASMVTAHAFQLGVASFPVLAIITLLRTHDLLHVILLVVPLAGLIALALGVSLAVCALTVYFRDMPYVYELAVFLLWITTPVFYPVEIVPAAVLRIIVWNPLFPIVQSLRGLALRPATVDWQLLGLSLGAGIVALTLGWFVFRALEHEFMDLL